MDPRRALRGISDPKFRQVGFFSATGGQSHADPPDSDPSLPVSDISPASNSLSPVMIPPPRHVSLVPQVSAFRPNESSPFPVGSYKQSEFLSPSAYTDNSDDQTSSPRAAHCGDFQQSVASSPSVLFKMEVSKQTNSPDPPPEKSENIEMKKEKKAASSGVKPLKEKTTKAERRAIQEAQRAAKAAVKGNKSAVNASKPVKPTPLSKDSSSSQIITTSPPRMQFDDENKVVKANKRAVVKPVASRNIVELFRHLPQYEHEKRLPDLESKFFQVGSVHPAIYTVGMQYLAGDISDCNARCVAMLQAFRDSIKDYSAEPEKNLSRDLATKISSHVSYLVDCRPLSLSMGNAIRFLKARISSLPWDLSEAEAKASLISDIDHFISHKIVLAKEAIIKHAITKIRNGDVILTYGVSSAVEMLLLHAHQVGKQFRLIIVDSRPKLEGQLLLRKLVSKGISCTYTLITGISYVIHEVTRVFLGASSVLGNGMVYSSVGSASVAMVAHQFHVPVMVCCEAYKFHERVQLDSICSNELGDPDAVATVLGRQEVRALNGWAKTENLQVLNLIYDLMPPDFVSAIITEYGMIPPTSVPAIVREHGMENLRLDANRVS